MILSVHIVAPGTQGGTKLRSFCIAMRQSGRPGAQRHFGNLVQMLAARAAGGLH